MEQPLDLLFKSIFERHNIELLLTHIIQDPFVFYIV